MTRAGPGWCVDLEEQDIKPTMEDWYRRNDLEAKHFRKKRELGLVKPRDLELHPLSIQLRKGVDVEKIQSGRSGVSKLDHISECNTCFKYMYYIGFYTIHIRRICKMHA
jgi:hypothetical protein